MDAGRKREFKKRYKEAEILEARRSLQLSEHQLRELLTALDGHLGQVSSCDHTLTRTTRWIVEQGLNLEAVVTSLRELGGYCDCEVAGNVTPDLFGWPEH